MHCVSDMEAFLNAKAYSECVAGSCCAGLEVPRHASPY